MTRDEWKKRVKKALIDKGETQAKMADRLDYSRAYMRQVMCGVVQSHTADKAISEYCNIPMYVGGEE